MVNSISPDQLASWLLQIWGSLGLLLVDSTMECFHFNASKDGQVHFRVKGCLNCFFFVLFYYGDFLYLI